jgi:hypothetical protein
VSDDISRSIQEQQRQNDMRVQEQFAAKQANDQIQRNIESAARHAGSAAVSGGAVPPSGSSSSQAPTPDPLQPYRQFQGTDNVPRGNETFEQQMQSTRQAEQANEQRIASTRQAEQTNQAPPQGVGNEAARRGTEFHEMVKGNQPKGEYGNGWSLSRQDETVGGTRRPDEVWVNHAEKRVVIVDHYTGGKRDVSTASGPESAAHNAKGLSYVNEPEIKQLMEEGYKADYAVGSRPAFLSPKHLH